MYKDQVKLKRRLRNVAELENELFSNTFPWQIRDVKIFTNKRIYRTQNIPSIEMLDELMNNTGHKITPKNEIYPKAVNIYGKSFKLEKRTTKQNTS